VSGDLTIRAGELRYPETIKRENNLQYNSYREAEKEKEKKNIEWPLRKLKPATALSSIHLPLYAVLLQLCCAS
jgi:hypothetical protein